MPRILSIVAILIMLFTSPQTAFPFTLYSTRANGFSGFSNPHIVDGCLTIQNHTCADSITLCDSILSPYKLQIVTRIANLNNQENKSHTVTDSLGNTHKISNPIWGIVFNYTSPSNYCAILLKAHNSAPYDILDKRTINCTLLQVSSGILTELASKTITSDIDFYTGYNLISLTINRQNLTLKIGKTKLQEIFSTQIILQQNSKAGIITGPGSKTAIERFIIKQQQDPTSILSTDWTIDKINEYLSKSSDPNEGYWYYLDRIIDEKQLRLGGRYQFALIATPIGYDIIYISGAEVNDTKWKTGMIKGHLTKTQFQNHFDLTWYDSDFQPFSVDVNATIETSSIITFNFPIHKTLLRFAKQAQ